MLQRAVVCVTVCCIVRRSWLQTVSQCLLQCVVVCITVCCSVRCSVLLCVLQCVAACVALRSRLHCVAVCVAECCSVIQCIRDSYVRALLFTPDCVAVFVALCCRVCCSVLSCVLQCVAVYVAAWCCVCYNVLQRVLQCVAVCVTVCCRVCCSVLFCVLQCVAVYVALCGCVTKKCIWDGDKYTLLRLWSGFINPPFSEPTFLDNIWTVSFRKRNGKAKHPLQISGFFFVVPSSFDLFGEITGFTPKLLETQSKSPEQKFASRKIVRFSTSIQQLCCSFQKSFFEKQSCSSWQFLCVFYSFACVFYSFSVSFYSFGFRWW